MKIECPSCLHVSKIRQDLFKIREDGFAVSVSERVKGTIGIAAPIFRVGHNIVASLGIAAPLSRLSVDKAKIYGPLIKQMTGRISNQLGDFIVNK